MAGSTFGTLFSITTFGESHGEALGVVIDGCPAGLTLTPLDIQAFLDRRKPGQSAISTPRKEADAVQILSGVFEGKTTGTPIALLVPNTTATAPGMRIIPMIRSMASVITAAVAALPDARLSDV